MTLRPWRHQVADMAHCPTIKCGANYSMCDLIAMWYDQPIIHMHLSVAIPCYYLLISLHVLEEATVSRKISRDNLIFGQILHLGQSACIYSIKCMIVVTQTSSSGGSIYAFADFLTGLFAIIWDYIYLFCMISWLPQEHGMTCANSSSE